MKRVVSVSIYFYDLMLRLYPPQFRAEYAAEMREVFRQAIAENENTLSLLGLLLAEMRDLPISVIREHWRERQQTRLMMQLEGFVLNRIYSPQRFRFCMISLLGLAALYIFSALTAYFVFDLHTNSLWKAQQWWSTVGQQPAYLFNQIPLLYLLGIVLWLLSPVWIIGAGSFLAVMLWGQWHQLAQRLRLLGAIALIAAIAMFVSMGSPIGFMAALWFYD
jgi:hypothetical protein